jgi:hypothetical protein
VFKMNSKNYKISLEHVSHESKKDQWLGFNIFFLNIQYKCKREIVTFCGTRILEFFFLILHILTLLALWVSTSWV